MALQGSFSTIAHANLLPHNQREQATGKQLRICRALSRGACRER